MKKLLLALLTSPMFPIFMLLGTAPTHAEQLNQSVDSATVTSIEIARSANPAASQVDEQNSLLYSDRMGDLAIAQRGCDCAGCRNAVMQLVGEGKLVLPQ